MSSVKMINWTPAFASIGLQRILLWVSRLFVVHLNLVNLNNLKVQNVNRPFLLFWRRLVKLVLEGRVTVSNNFTKRGQNGSKIGTRDKFATHLRQEIFISNEIVIYTIFLGSVIFPYNSLYTQAVAYTTYFELGEPVFSTGRWEAFWWPFSAFGEVAAVEGLHPDPPLSFNSPPPRWDRPTVCFKRLRFLPT